MRLRSRQSYSPHCFNFPYLDLSPSFNSELEHRTSRLALGLSILSCLGRRHTPTNIEWQAMCQKERVSQRSEVSVMKQTFSAKRRQSQPKEYFITRQTERSRNVTLQHMLNLYQQIANKKQHSFFEISSSNKYDERVRHQCQAGPSNVFKTLSEESMAFDPSKAHCCACMKLDQQIANREKHSC